MNDKKRSAAKPAVKTNNSAVKNEAAANEQSYAIAFGPLNYILLGVGVLLLGIGYILLAGGGSDDPTVFNPAMFDSRRLVVAPILIVLGLVVEILAIMLRPKERKQEEQ